MESIEPVAPLDVEFDWHPVKQAYFEGFNDGATRLPTDDGSFQWENSNAISHTRAEPSLDAAPVAWMYEHDGMVYDEKNQPLLYTYRLPQFQNEPWTETALYTAPQAASALREAAIKARAALSELLATRDPVVYSDALKALDEALARY